MADLRPPARWAMDVSDLTKFDVVTAHLAAWASYYAYYDDAADMFSELVGAIHIARTPADPPTGRPAGWLFTIDEANIFVWAGTTDAVQLYGIVRDCHYGRILNQPSAMVGMSGVSRWVTDILAGSGNLMKSMMTAKKTIFCGHSIGGALAMQLFTALKGDGGFSPQPSCYYAFGSPKPGNRLFANQATPGFNVVTPDDPVPKLPPLGYVRLGFAAGPNPTYTVSPAEPFVSAGTTVYLYPGSKAEIEEPGTKIIPGPSPIEFDAARFGAKLAFFTAPQEQPRKVVQAWNDSIAAHEMRLYLTRLEQLLPVNSGQHATLGDDGKKAEAELPKEPDGNALVPDKPAYGLFVPIPQTIPAASNGVAPLSARRRH